MLKINPQKGAIEISTIAATIITAAIVAAVSIIATIKYYEGLNISAPISVITPKLTPSVTPISESVVISTPELTITPISNSEAEKIIKDKANKVLLALKNKNFTELSTYIHSDKGVRFSPYVNVGANDVFFTKEQIKKLYQSSAKYVWGYSDGSGFPIEETFKDYYLHYIYDQDFISAKEVGYNQILGVGNTGNNIADFYKGSITVEYHFSGFDPQYEGQDWESLNLVFQEKDNIWYLVGIVHDQWTI